MANEKRYCPICGSELESWTEPSGCDYLRETIREYDCPNGKKHIPFNAEIIFSKRSKKE